MSENTKYLEIANNIKQKIISSIYKPNELLPSEKQLLEEYKVSRRTIRHSIMKLVEDGFLYTVPGKGTFVHMIANNKYRAHAGIGSILKNGYDDSRLYSAKIVNPDIYDVYHLQVAPNEKVLCIKWLLIKDGETIAFDLKTIPYLPGISIGESDLGFTNLQDILLTKFSKYELKEEVLLTAVYPDEEVREVFGIEDGSPETVVLVDTKVFDSDMVILGWNKLFIRAEECEVKGKLVR